MNHLLAIEDLSTEEIMGILDLARKVKARQEDYVNVFAARAPKRLFGHTYKQGALQKKLAQVYYKTSTRTQVSFFAGMADLGGVTQTLNVQSTNIQVGGIYDDIRSMAGYVDVIAARVHDHEDIVAMAKASRGIPVINALSRQEHPCQTLADLLTIKETFGRLEGITIAYVGDGFNNVTHSLISGAYKTGMKIRVASPEGYDPDPVIVKNAGERYFHTRDPKEAVKGADVVYTDTWVSLGHEKEEEARKAALGAYQVNEALMPKQARFMHCLPPHRGYEVTDGVIDGPASLTTLQSDNRMHAQKAILLKLIEPAYR